MKVEVYHLDQSAKSKATYFFKDCCKKPVESFVDKMVRKFL